MKSFTSSDRAPADVAGFPKATSNVNDRNIALLLKTSNQGDLFFHSRKILVENSRPTLPEILAHLPVAGSGI
ncbi:MAG: hypothetical protein HZA50_04615 [Planctomycetes bacterium]|nr:hypothetical protein [Planctomycetota bacterium]